MDPLKLFIPITKVDVAQRLVYGVATAEEEDRAGEVCDYASTKPYYEAWSGAIHKTTGGKSLGNVRAMHGKVAAGKLTAINFDDAARKIEVCSKIVDDAEWKKVEEGVYTGFSQGGAYVKRWKDEAGKQRYTADPCEISLVDLPCLPSATFDVIKADGAHEQRHFADAVLAKPPTNDEVAARASELAKAAGAEARWPDYVEAARAELVKAALPAPEPIEPTTETASPGARPTDGDEWEQVWKSKRDGATFRTKAELRKHHEALDAAAAAQAAAGPALDALSDIEAALGKREATAPEPKTESRPLRRSDAPDFGKSLYTAAYFAELLASLRGMAASAAYDALFSSEGADADFAAQMKGWVAQGCALLVSIIQDEVDGLADADDVVIIEAAAGLPVDHLAALGKMIEDDAKRAAFGKSLAKAGKRNSAKDQDKLQAAHDALVAAGATCGGDAGKAAVGSDLMKTADDLARTRDDLAKVTGERDALRTTLDGLQPRLDAILKSVKAIEAQPVPAPVTRTVSKGEDTGGVSPELAALANDPQAMSLALIKLAQQHGQPLVSRGG